MRVRPIGWKGKAMNIDLSQDQLALLRELLDEAYRDLRYEIADTDNSRFKAQLRVRESQLGELLEMVGGPIERD
jgi:hypothetical protein